MKVFKSVLAGGGVCLAAVVLIMPFVLFGQPASQELWILQAMQETGRHFQLVPRLNGMELPGQNPLQIMLLSFLPASAAWARLAMIILGRWSPPGVPLCPPAVGLARGGVRGIVHRLQHRLPAEL